MLKHQNARSSASLVCYYLDKCKQISNIEAELFLKQIAITDLDTTQYDIRSKQFLKVSYLLG